MADLVQYYGTGRRKSSIARVYLRPGSGKFTVNKKECDVYFVTPQQRAAARRSLGIADIGETFDVITTVRGGGVMGQADAVKLGIARALMEFNPELRKTLKAEGLVTRDSRGKERKKYGQKGRERGSSSARDSCQLQVSGCQLKDEHHPRTGDGPGHGVQSPVRGINPASQRKRPVGFTKELTWQISR